MRCRNHWGFHRRLCLPSVFVLSIWNTWDSALNNSQSIDYCLEALICCIWDVILGLPKCLLELNFFTLGTLCLWKHLCRYTPGFVHTYSFLNAIRLFTVCPCLSCIGGARIGSITPGAAPPVLNRGEGFLLDLLAILLAQPRIQSCACDSQAMGACLCLLGWGKPPSARGSRQPWLAPLQRSTEHYISQHSYSSQLEGLRTLFSFNLLAVLVLFCAQPDVRLHGHQPVLLSGACHQKTSEVDLDQITFRRLWTAVLGLLSISHWYRLFYKCPAHQLVLCSLLKSKWGLPAVLQELKGKSICSEEWDAGGKGEWAWLMTPQHGLTVLLLQKGLCQLHKRASSLMSSVVSVSASLWNCPSVGW